LRQLLLVYCKKECNRFAPPAPAVIWLIFSKAARQAKREEKSWGTYINGSYTPQPEQSGNLHQPSIMQPANVCLS
jgi:hypothetical protein